jgi:tetratricopeptide (TPR) repeat protein
MWKFPLERRCALALILGIGAGTVAEAQRGADLQAQILYGAEAEDSNQLTDLVQMLGAAVKNAPTDEALRYHLAHADYRYALLVAEQHPHEAETALQDCTDQLGVLLGHSPKSAESLALDSACYARIARYRALQSVLLRSRAKERLDSAYKIAPRNPRVNLLLAEAGLEHAQPGTPEYDQAFAQLSLAAQLFDQSQATSDDAPGWGHAEAYLDLGRELERRGDLIGARNAIEKALIAAPDYKAAQRQLLELENH